MKFAVSRLKDADWSAAKDPTLGEAVSGWKNQIRQECDAALAAIDRGEGYPPMED